MKRIVASLRRLCLLSCVLFISACGQESVLLPLLEGERVLAPSCHREARQLPSDR